jgi:hypothetical protein
MQNTINNILDSIGRSNVVRYTAIYFLIAGILSVCGGCALFTAGGLAGIGGLLRRNATGALFGVGIGAVIYGLISVLSAPLLIIAAWGLFNRKPWAHTGAVVAGAVNVVSDILWFLLGGGGILSILFIVVSAFLTYVFYSDAGIRAELGKAPLPPAQ